MRIVLVTGKGGVGKTTVAAATAVRAAERGQRVIVCSTDPAHSLGDAFGSPLGDRPTPIALPASGGILFGQELDSRTRLEQSWGEVRDYLSALLDWAGADALSAEELAVVPGLDEVLALAELRTLARSGDWDLIVVDCAPTAETVRLLSLPDVLSWYMDRVFPAQRRATRVVRPLLARLTNLPVAGDEVFTALRRLYDRLDGVRELLLDPDVTSARVVCTPERVVVAEARRTFTYLALFGYHVDAVVVNRVLPDVVRDPWFHAQRARQEEQLGVIGDAFAPLPMLLTELTPEEPVGTYRLGRIGRALYGESDPGGRFAVGPAMRVASEGDALFLELPLPHAAREEIDLGRLDDELLVAVGPYRRAVVLPDSLARRDVTDAKLVGGTLRVRFEAVPE